MTSNLALIADTIDRNLMYQAVHGKLIEDTTAGRVATDRLGHGAAYLGKSSGKRTLRMKIAGLPDYDDRYFVAAKRSLSWYDRRSQYVACLVRNDDGYYTDAVWVSKESLRKRLCDTPASFRELCKILPQEQETLAREVAKAIDPHWKESSSESPEQAAIRLLSTRSVPAVAPRAETPTPTAPSAMPTATLPPCSPASTSAPAAAATSSSSPPTARDASIAALGVAISRQQQAELPNVNEYRLQKGLPPLTDRRNPNPEPFYDALVTEAQSGRTHARKLSREDYPDLSRRVLIGPTSGGSTMVGIPFSLKSEGDPRTGDGACKHVDECVVACMEGDTITPMKGRYVAATCNIDALARKWGRTPDEIRAYLKNEAACYETLRGRPGVIDVLFHVETDTHFYFVMEHCKGDLAGLIKRLHSGSESMTFDNKLELAKQLFQAIADTEAQGITHRDIKPENVLIGSDGQLRLADFGLACFNNRFDETRGRACGTQPYKPPEVIGLGAGSALAAATTPKFDCFSVALVVSQLLYPESSFESSFAGSYYREILNGQHREWTPQFPSPSTPMERQAQVLMRRALDPDPAKRLTASAVVAEIDRIQRMSS